MINKVSFIGAGSMAEAIIAGLVNKEFVKKEQIYVSNKENEAKLLELSKKYGVVGNSNKKEAMEGADVVFLATKPYDIKNAVTEIRDYLQSNQLVISVVAGISTTFIQSIIGQEIPIIRSMPNTSATIGYSATAIAKGMYASDNHIKIAEQLFSAIGTVSTVKEDDMHIVTAISGSGPAYIYYLVEAMEKVAIEEGLDAQTAKELISQTVLGAGEMLKYAKEPVTTLRENVTSPNGTTAAGLATLANYKFQEAMMECVKSAKNRSVELGKNE